MSLYLDADLLPGVVDGLGNHGLEYGFEVSLRILLVAYRPDTIMLVAGQVIHGGVKDNTLVVLRGILKGGVQRVFQQSDILGGVKSYQRLIIRSILGKCGIVSVCLGC